MLMVLYLLPLYFTFLFTNNSSLTHSLTHLFTYLEKASYRAAAAAKSAENVVASSTSNSSTSPSANKRQVSSLGEILEMIEIQSIIVVLLVML